MALVTFVVVVVVVVVVAVVVVVVVVPISCGTLPLPNSTDTFLSHAPVSLSKLMLDSCKG